MDVGIYLYINDNMNSPSPLQSAHYISDRGPSFVGYRVQSQMGDFGRAEWMWGVKPGLKSGALLADPFRCS